MLVSRLVFPSLALPALIALAGCGSEQPRSTQVIVQPPAQPQATAMVAPGPPPAPRSETVPPPPAGAGPMVWQPGHWVLSGNNWVWQSGQYTPPPAGETTWVPGRWVRQPTGGWSWVDGHWA